MDSYEFNELVIQKEILIKEKHRLKVIGGLVELELLRVSKLIDESMKTMAKQIGLEK